MRLFDDGLLERLRPVLGPKPVHFVGLGQHDFQIAFDDLRIQNMLRVDFHIGGVTHAWDGGACAAPVWLLIGQTFKDLMLVSASILRLTFASGDWIALHTDEGPYENQTFLWPDPDSGEAVLRVF